MFKNISSVLMISLVFIGIPKTSFNKTRALISGFPSGSNSSPNNLICMMQLENGTIIDLISLCDKTVKQENLSPRQVERKVGEAEFLNQLYQEMKSKEPEFRNQVYQACKRINRRDSFVVYPDFKRVCEKEFQQNF
jgi:hypothetical protein